MQEIASGQRHDLGPLLVYKERGSVDGLVNVSFQQFPLCRDEHSQSPRQEPND